MSPVTCPRCGSDKTKDVPIHGGISTRTDCAKCGRFIYFSRWHGKAQDYEPKKIVEPDPEPAEAEGF